MYFFSFIHSILLLKTLPQSLYIAQSQNCGVPHSVRACSNPQRRPHLFYPPTYADTILLGEELTGGGTVRRRQNNYLAAE